MNLHNIKVIIILTVDDCLVFLVKFTYTPNILDVF